MDSIVNFRVTHVDHDIAHINGDAKPDSHFAALMGELGCWVDPEVTRLIQGGSENAIVPDVGEYFGLGELIEVKSEKYSDYSEGNGVTRNVEIRESVLCAAGSSFSQLRDLLAATLHPAALVYQLSVTVLLSGSRGVGKRTIARWAAQDLGLHVLEVIA
jgi:peroxin-6